MKRILSLLLVATLVFALSGCGNDKDTIVKDDTNKKTELQEADNGGDEKADVSDEKGDSSKTENSNKTEKNSSNEQSSTDQTTDVNNTTTNDSSNKNNNQSNSNSAATKPNSNTQTNTHKHSYSAATCTQPKKCSCGATEGKALGHTYANATCTKPKTCTCGVTSGNALGHNYDEDGVCTRCKVKDPNFTYPTVSSMGGVWKTFFETQGIEKPYLVEYRYFFRSGELGFAAVYYTLKEHWSEDYNGPIDEARSIIWNNKCYYEEGGECWYNEPIYRELDDRIIITDEENREVILQRIATNTLKVISAKGNCTDNELNKLLTFYKN